MRLAMAMAEAVAATTATRPRDLSSRSARVRVGAEAPRAVAHLKWHFKRFVRSQPASQREC